MNIRDIDIQQLKVEQQYLDAEIYNRAVYYAAAADTYLKIWGEDYFYHPYFEKAYHSGFYTGIAEIEDIIENDEKTILGYITKAGKRPGVIDNGKLQNLIERVSKNCFSHNMVHIDFNEGNIVEYENRYCLTDLSPSIPVAELNTIPGIKNKLEYCNYFYRKQIRPLLSHHHSYVLRHCTPPDKEIKYGTANGRIFLEREYLPSLKGKVLFVGINYYTEFYHKLVQTPELFETLDVSESVIEYGSPHIHYVCDIRDFKSQGYLYDHVCFFGIIGHSDSVWEIITERAEIIETIKKVDSLVAPGGTLLFAPSLQTLSIEFWNEMYNMPEFKKYELLMLKRIDINYIWHGRKK